MNSSFRSGLVMRQAETKSLLCLELATDSCSESVRNAMTMCQKNMESIRATEDIVCAYSFNLADYLWYGEQGIKALSQTITKLGAFSPGSMVLLDGQFSGRTEGTNSDSAEFAFETMHADAVTVSPYLGRTVLMPFFRHPQQGIFITCRTKETEYESEQDLLVPTPGVGWRIPLYQEIASRIAKTWSPENCGLIIDAGCIKELRIVREIIREKMMIFVPNADDETVNFSEVIRFGTAAEANNLLVGVSTRHENAIDLRERILAFHATANRVRSVTDAKLAEKT
jgi:orotidine-5'-phosphate decarboxylase